MKQAMSYDKSVCTFGIAVDKTGHVFKSTEGTKFNQDFDTPNSEQAETAFALEPHCWKLRPVLIHYK